MLPEIGLFCLILALCLAILQCALPLWGMLRHRTRWMQVARPLAMGQSFLITIAFFLLCYLFSVDDFSVLYVAEQSHSALPFIYKIGAVWGGHSGSWLLWVWLLSLWTLVFTQSSRTLPTVFTARVLIVLGVINVGFLLFLLSVSNPFLRILPAPLEGRDLNPLLQDMGLMIHPPLLYLGYVGFAMPFAFAVGVLGAKDVDYPWAKWMRPWVLSAFACLSMGIALGSWWAYHELGWGGWWFWDPVENASLIPWLLSIALIHALMMSDKRGLALAWSLLLAMMVFAMSLVASFLVRSGILISVHTFANDPGRGVFLLTFIFLLIGGTLLLYAYRVKQWYTPKVLLFFSREGMMLFGSALLVVAAMTILLGTLFPLLYEAMFNDKISVGLPYFNKVFVPLILPVLWLVPLGPVMRWGENTKALVWHNFRMPLLLSVVLGFGIPWCMQGQTHWQVGIGLSTGFWIILGTWKHFAYKTGCKIAAVKHLSLGAWGMLWAHMGTAVLVIGITVLSHYSVDKDVYMHPGQSLSIGQHDLLFKKLAVLEGPNYVAHQAHFILDPRSKAATDLWPEKRIYIASASRMTEAAIASIGFGDIYIAMGSFIKDDYWSFRICYKPFMHGVWMGAGMLMVGGFLSSLGRRRRVS